jgi:hypothetical protein
MKNVTESNPPAIPMFDKQKYKLFPTSKDTLLLHKELEELPLLHKELEALPGIFIIFTNFELYYAFILIFCI